MKGPMTRSNTPRLIPQAINLLFSSSKRTIGASLPEAPYTPLSFTQLVLECNLPEIFGAQEGPTCTDSSRFPRKQRKLLSALIEKATSSFKAVSTGFE